LCNPLESANEPLRFGLTVLETKIMLVIKTRLHWLVMLPTYKTEVDGCVGCARAFKDSRFVASAIEIDRVNI
jgi:hypothetical protein